MAACIPRPPLSPSERQALSGLSRRLTELGFNEYNVHDWLGGWDLPMRRFQQIPSYLWHIRRANSLGARLAGFALLNQDLSLADARLAFGECLEVLHRQGMLAVEGDLVRPLADLYPCEGSHLFADHKFSRFKRMPNHVYEVGGDSFCLARTTPRQPVGRALDLCTGSGVHAVLAARHSAAVTGVDINARALDFCRLNAIINDVDDHCSFVEGSLYAPLGDRQFDLITANTPFVPTPRTERLEAYRWGGESGDDINQDLVKGLVQHLAPGGTLALFTNYSLKEGADSLENVQRVADWLDGGAGWGISLVHTAATVADLYIELQIFDWGDPGAYHERFANWIECYGGQGIVGIGEGTFLVHRLPEGHPGYQRRIEIDHPRRPMNSTVEDWLSALEKGTDPAWQPDWSAPARVHPRVSAVLQDALGGPNWVTFPEGWVKSEHLDAQDFALVTGRAPLGELCDGLSLSRGAARDRVAGLVQRMVLMA